MATGEKLAKYIMDNVRSEASIRLDFELGLCTPHYSNGKLVGAEYKDGRIFSAAGDEFHTDDFKGFVKMFDYAHDMAASESADTAETGRALIRNALSL